MLPISQSDLRYENQRNEFRCMEQAESHCLRAVRAMLAAVSRESGESEVAAVGDFTVKLPLGNRI